MGKRKALKDLYTEKIAVVMTARQRRQLARAAKSRGEKMSVLVREGIDHVISNSKK